MQVNVYIQVLIVFIHITCVQMVKQYARMHPGVKICIVIQSYCHRERSRNCLSFIVLFFPSVPKIFCPVAFSFFVWFSKTWQVCYFLPCVTSILPVSLSGKARGRTHPLALGGMYHRRQSHPSRMALPASVANLQSSLCACVCVWVFVCYSHHVCMFAYMCALLVRVASRVCFHLLTWFILVCFLHFNKSKSLCRCGQLAYCIYTSPSMSAFKFTSQIMFVFVRLDCVKPFLPLLYMCVWLVVCALTLSIRPRCGALSCYTCPARPM